MFGKMFWGMLRAWEIGFGRGHTPDEHLKAQMKALGIDPSKVVRASSARRLIDEKIEALRIEREILTNERLKRQVSRSLAHSLDREQTQEQERERAE